MEKSRNSPDSSTSRDIQLSYCVRLISLMLENLASARATKDRILRINEELFKEPTNSSIRKAKFQEIETLQYDLSLSLAVYQSLAKKASQAVEHHVAAHDPAVAVELEIRLLEFEAMIVLITDLTHRTFNN